MTEPPDAYGADGVDVTLIRWFLTLTPAERLSELESVINDIQEIRRLNGHGSISRIAADPEESAS